MTPAAAEGKAREILQSQIESSKNGPGAVRTWFADDAMVFTHDNAEAPSDQTHYGLLDGGFEGTQASNAKITKVIAGGSADTVWFYAEVAVTAQGEGAPSTDTTYVVEVATAPAWKVVAGSFREHLKIQPSGINHEVGNATGSDGPLAKLAGDATAVGAALASDAIVIVDPGAARGADAKTALAGAKLDGLKLFQRAREVRTPTLGVLQANFDQPAGKLTNRGAVTLVAIPDGDKWKIVLAEYIGQ